VLRAATFGGMARRLRSFAPGGVAHLTAHGVDDQPIFRSDLDRFSLLAHLRRVTERVRWRVLAWCFMDTHYHLLVVAGRDPRVSWAMQTLNSVYAREFNHRHRRRGHLFGERYTDTAVTSDEHLDAAIAYILMNPVAAGIVRRPDEWPWSGDHRLEPRVPQRSRNVRSSAATRTRPATSRIVPASPPTDTPAPSSPAATT
jgi:putative transposase